MNAKNWTINCSPVQQQQILLMAEANANEYLVLSFAESSGKNLFSCFCLSHCLLVDMVCDNSLGWKPCCPLCSAFFLKGRLPPQMRFSAVVIDCKVPCRQKPLFRFCRCNKVGSSLVCQTLEIGKTQRVRVMLFLD